MVSLKGSKKTGASEAHVTKKIKAFLDELKLIEALWFWKVSDRFTAGIPDYVGVYHGRFWALEIKRPGGKPRKLQEYVMRKIEAAGGAVTWVDSLDEAKLFFDSMLPFKRLQ